MADDSAAADDAPSSSSIAGSHRFLWLSDVHLDPMYGTPLAFAASYYPDADCTGAGMSADADDDAAAPYYFGRYGCDSPPALVGGALDAAIEAFETTSSGGEEGGGGRRQRPSLVIVTGDAIRHGIDQIFSGGDFSEGAESKADNGTTTTSSEAKAGDEAGDEAASAPWHEAAMDEAGKVVRSFASMMRTSFPDSVIVYALGNNDVVPDYYLALFDDVVVDDDGVAREEGIATIPTPGTAGMLGVLYDALVVGGDDDDDDDDDDVSILTSADASTFLAGGYYSRTIHDGSLVVLSLNTILYSSFHEPIMRHRDIDDPGGQFAWMRKILSGCRREVETCRSAMIVGHVPPAMGSFRHQQLWREGYIRTYYEIVKEFDDVVVAQLFGHLHSDEFRVGLASSSYNDEGGDGEMIGEDISLIPALSTPILLGPSVTPLHGNYPSFRIVRYDRGGRRGGTTTDAEGGYRIVDYDSYSYSMIGKEGDGGWSKLYTFSDVYGDVASDVIEEEGLSSRTFRTIVGAMEDERWGGESPTLKAYRELKLSGAKIEANQFDASGTCDSKCRDDYMCIFMSATTSGYDRCMLERGETWYRVGGGRLGVVAGVLFAIMIIGFAFVRCRRMGRDKRKHYSSAPSVHDEAKDDGIDSQDREFTYDEGKDDGIDSHDREII